MFFELLEILLENNSGVMFVADPCFSLPRLVCCGIYCYSSSIMTTLWMKAVLKRAQRLINRLEDKKVLIHVE